FFFQAEDGIRDRNVTGVQTCALPISYLPIPSPFYLDMFFASALLFHSYIRSDQPAPIHRWAYKISVGHHITPHPTTPVPYKPSPSLLPSFPSLPQLPLFFHYLSTRH